MALAAESEALADPASWTARRAPRLAHGVALRALPAGAPPVLDPLGQLVVQQQVVPLNTGGRRGHLRRRAGGRRHALPAGGDVERPVQHAGAGAFAPARYFTMSDDDKLVAPSFEPWMPGSRWAMAGVVRRRRGSCRVGRIRRFVLNPVLAGSAPAPAVSAAPSAPAPYKLPAAALRAQRPRGAAARAPVRRVGGARFRNAAVTPAATLVAPGWRTAPGGRRRGRRQGAAVVTTWSAVKASLATLNRGGARWLIVPVHELPT